MKLPADDFCIWPRAPRAAGRLRIAGCKHPTRPIRLVIPFPPGGAFDAVGRPWAEKMKPLLGTVVVENMVVAVR
jgi:tripartite-type tricarboxylate transporter receptor subunit TctC